MATINTFIFFGLFFLSSILALSCTTIKFCTKIPKFHEVLACQSHISIPMTISLKLMQLPLSKQITNIPSCRKDVGRLPGLFKGSVTPPRALVVGARRRDGLNSTWRIPRSANCFSVECTLYLLQRNGTSADRVCNCQIIQTRWNSRKQLMFFDWLVSDCLKEIIFSA